MNRFSKFFILLSIFYFLLFTSLPTLAAVPEGSACLNCAEPGGFLTGMSKDCICCGDCQLIDFFRIARIIIQGFLGVIGVYGLIFTIVGGIMMIISGGKQDRILQAKRMIGFSIIGMLIAFLAWQIVNLVVCGITQGKLEQACTIFGQAWNVFPQ